MFDIKSAEIEREKTLGSDHPAWTRYVRIRDLVMAMGPLMGMSKDDKTGWNTFILVMEGFPPDPEPANVDLEQEAKVFLRSWLGKGQETLLDVHEAILLYDDLLIQDKLEPHEILDRMGKHEELPFSDEMLAALLKVVPQKKPKIEIPEMPDA